MKGHKVGEDAKGDIDHHNEICSEAAVNDKGSVMKLSSLPTIPRSKSRKENKKGLGPIQTEDTTNFVLV